MNIATIVPAKDNGRYRMNPKELVRKERRARESEAEAILALAEAGILPVEFAEKIKGMPALRNRIIHDYLPNEFDAEKLFESIQNLDDFAQFSRYILRWIENG
jgi:uncharacterized protein YutE (UPF0331/DUF86 family)